MQKLLVISLIMVSCVQGQLERGEGWDLINGFIENYTPYGFEFTVGENENYLIDFKPLRDKGIRVWVNSLYCIFY